MFAFCPSSAALQNALLLMILLSSGCAHFHEAVPINDGYHPQERSKVNIPDYTIESPDILKIDALQVIPLPPYKIQSLDILAIRVAKTLPDEPIAGLFSVEPDGTVNLGVSYGKVNLAGLTLDEAKAEIEKRLMKVLKEPRVDITIAQGRGVQQIRGEHLVRPDGSISLGSYGSVKLCGLTLPMAKEVIEAHLTRYLQNPEVVVDVLAYNSKVYYVIFDQGGAGQRIHRLPFTGNETVLDAISQVSGLTTVSDQQQIWLARPSCEHEEEEVLKVDWKGITAHGRVQTNYQLFPGDRIFINAQPMMTFDTHLARIISPFERLFGFTLLGTTTVTTLKNPSGTIGGNGGAP
jgi:polysaccharide biosynthesis/export protein